MKINDAKAPEEIAGSAHFLEHMLARVLQNEFSSLAALRILVGIFDTLHKPGIYDDYNEYSSGNIWLKTPR